MALPFEPEPIATLRARYPAAVAELVPAAEVRAERRPAPSKDRAHVFDTETGLRLIVSREQFPDGRIGVHVSASWHRSIARATLESLQAEIAATWAAVSGSGRRLELVAVSPGGVPHFFLETLQ